MKAVWYERFGPADEVLTHGEIPDPSPGPGEVLVRVHATGINPSDVKLRAGARPGATMAYPRVIPQSDGAGVIEAVMDLTGGAGVDRIVEVDFAANQDASLAVIKPGGTIASYASASQMAPTLQFYPFMFKDVTLRMLIVYQIDPATHARGAAQLADWLAAGQLSHAVVPGGALTDMAAAHKLVEAGEKLGTVVVRV